MIVWVLVGAAGGYFLAGLGAVLWMLYVRRREGW